MDNFVTFNFASISFVLTGSEPVNLKLKVVRLKLTNIWCLVHFCHFYIYVFIPSIIIE